MPKLNGARASQNGHGKKANHLAEVRAAEAEIEHLETAQHDLLGNGLAAVGLSRSATVPSLTDGLGAAGWLPLLTLGLLVAVFEVPRWVLFVLAPEIGGALGTGVGTVSLIATMGSFALALALFGFVAFVHRRARRHTAVGASAVGAGFANLLSSMPATWGGLLGSVALGNGAAASAGALHRPLLLDTYGPGVRGRVLGLYRAAQAAGGAIAALLVVVTVHAFDLTWRSTYLVAAVLTIAVAVLASRLGDPGYGHLDMARIRDTVGPGATGTGSDETGESIRMGEQLRQVLMIPTMRTLLSAYVVLGMMLAPLHAYVFWYLDERFHMAVLTRGLFFGLAPILGIAAVIAVGRRGDELFGRSPAELLGVGGVLLAAGTGCVALGGVAPALPLAVLLFSLALALFLVVTPILDLTTLSLVEAEARPHAAALAEAALLVAGGFMGTSLLAAIQTRYGFGPAFVLELLPGAVGLGLLRKAAGTYADDLGRMVGAVIEDAEVGISQQQGRHLPLLACRHIDFSYGQLQVLFNVDFTVDDGETVALLGTNGAGKSTLLRVISGLSLPQRGSVRFRGRDITHFGAERRVGAGITQIPGGKAVFGRLSVAENMRMHGYLLGRDKQKVDTAIDRVFETFPGLATRRNQMAATLSGGEQQMLALGKALILRPRLLLIDELSLGLAPVIVGELLEMVRGIRDQGTAVVLVEQSVNIALRLADHAYFMEKGEIRFDGPSNLLVERGDLLRSVFLEGAAKGMALQD
jgi:ABC-type branched-subunit amino acid transport system ATPase component/sugar phosphate permease